jgi:hypothetical protein
VVAAVEQALWDNRALKDQVAEQEQVELEQQIQ